MMAAEPRPRQVQATRKGIRHSEAFLSWVLVKRVVCAAIIARLPGRREIPPSLGGLDRSDTQRGGRGDRSAARRQRRTHVRVIARRKLGSKCQLALTDVREVEAKEGGTSVAVGIGSGEAPSRLSQTATARLRMNSATKDMHATIDRR